MGALKRVGIALVVGAVLVGIAGLIGALTGTQARFFQACAVVSVVCVFVTLVMSGALFFGDSHPSRAAMVAHERPAPDQGHGDPVDPDTRMRLNSVYPLIAGLPSIVIALVHYVF